MLTQGLGSCLSSESRWGKLCTHQGKEYLRTSSLCTEALLEGMIRSGAWFLEMGQNKRFVLFLQNKIPVCVGRKRQ